MLCGIPQGHYTIVRCFLANRFGDPLFPDELEPARPFAPDIPERLDRIEHVLLDLDEAFTMLTLQLKALRAALVHTDHYGLGRGGLTQDESFTRHHGCC